MHMHVYISFVYVRKNVFHVCMLQCVFLCMYTYVCTMTLCYLLFNPRVIGLEVYNAFLFLIIYSARLILHASFTPIVGT